MVNGELDLLGALVEYQSQGKFNYDTSFAIFPLINSILIDLIYLVQFYLQVN